LHCINDKKAVSLVRTQLLILILFGFLNAFASGGGDHQGGGGAREGVGSPGTSNSAAQSSDQGGGGLALSFRYEPACSSYNPPGTANSAAPFGAGGTGLNDLSCGPDYLPLAPPPVQQAGEIGILGQNAPKLVPPKPGQPKPGQPKGITEENPDR
jgi:hypothetical protein